ncbi:MAG: DUF2961 domain-containing protein [Bacteroidales bacterium]|nr:DUF2961 domain-containing protein [Bacteroidales bacterium]
MKNLQVRKLLFASLLTTSMVGFAQTPFNGLDMSLSNLSRVSKAETRSISAENFTGEKGKGGMATPSDPIRRNENNASWAARDLGQTWKVNPYVKIAAGETLTIAEMEGPGAVQHIWMTPNMGSNWRWTIVRIYWDDEKTPSVECPIGDFFCMGWNEYAPLNSLAVCVNPGRAFNCYWSMPFRKKCKITIENIDPKAELTLYYQVDYTLTDVPEDAAYFHAQFRRTRYNESSDFTILDGVKGQGQYVGVYLAWGVHNVGWWGEGETKFFIDGDTKFPTICHTGLEDYFCGSYNFDVKGQYKEFTSPYSGLCQVIRPDGTYQSQQRFGLYRWHIQDPIRFKKSLRLTIQDLGWHYDGRYLAQHSDIASTAFWYQMEPHATFPQLPSWEALECN